MGQPIEGSNPSLSATPTWEHDIEIVPLAVATFTFPADEPNAGEEGVVVAHVIRHPSGIVLVDTGIGFGSQAVDDRYHPRQRRMGEALEDAGISVADIVGVVNCHLHIDHAGQNLSFPGIPIHAQQTEWDIAHSTDHTILEWVDFPGAEYRLRDGDYELLPGIRILATPGHTPGHQSVAVGTAEGLVLIAGQAVYSRGEWDGDPAAREGRSRAPDQAAYDASVAKLRSLDPVRVHFVHDREIWSRR